MDSNDLYEDEVESEPFLATAEQYKSFLETSVWQDIQQVCKDRIEIHRNNLEIADDPMTRGALRELRWLLRLPYLSVLELQKKEDEDEPTDS